MSHLVNIPGIGLREVARCDCGAAHPPARELAACSAPGCTTKVCDRCMGMICSHCDGAFCGGHTESVRQDGHRWDLCPSCKAEHEAETKAERAAVLALKPGLEDVLAKLDRMDRHEAFEALQRMSMEVIAA